MKKTHYLVMTILAICLVFAVMQIRMSGVAQAKDSQRLQTGRYQLVDGSFNTVAGNNILQGTQLHAVFKIDTVTGDVWRYQSDIDGKSQWVKTN